MKMFSSNLVTMATSHFLSTEKKLESISTNYESRNVIAPRVCAIKYPQLVFIPCFAHWSAFLSGDLLKSSIFRAF